MIDTKALRRVAVDCSWPTSPVPIGDIIDRLEAAEKAVTEAYQRGYATGQEEVAAERDALRAKIEQMEQQEPVAWRTFDGEGGYDYRSYEDNENYKLGWDARNPNHI